ncbi:MAG: MBL fold metallo-hydrolase [Oscillospiraceae bacterium]|nr:MBL fold metallo-hydrolase [Oscillospiraceae bacterium]
MAKKYSGKKVSEKDIKSFYRKNKNNKPMLIAAALIFAAVVYFTGGDILDTTDSAAMQTAADLAASLNDSNNEAAPNRTPTTVMDDGKLMVMVQDVGQGDSILIKTPEKAVLIDASESPYSDVILENIENAGIDKLDLVIATHAHSDHIGGMRKVITNVEVDEIVISPTPHTTSTYQKLLEAIDSEGIKLHIADPGMTFDMGDGAVFTIIGPADDFEDLNDSSVITRLDFGECSFLFSGDAELPAEQAVLASGMDINVDMMTAAHHGSSTSTGDAYLRAASPEYLSISCGTGNDYGHPHRETIQKLQGYTVNRTDLEGDITYLCDGSRIEVTTEK